MIVGAAAGAALAALAGCGSGATPSSGVASLKPTSSASPAAATAKADPAAYSACMRAHGVRNFPDPDAQGRINLVAVPGTGLDPNAASWQAAEDACRSLSPDGGPADPATVQKGMAQALKYSACMRAHGVTNFPDPKSGTKGIQLAITPEIGRNPHFASAQKACAALMQVPGGGQTLTDGGPGSGS